MTCDLSRLLPAVLVLALGACSGPEPQVVLDLAQALPFADRHIETGRVDIAEPGERMITFTGLGAPRRDRDGTGFRQVTGSQAGLNVWLFRPGSWMLRLRYRTSNPAARPGLGLGAIRLAEPPPAASWTELRALIPGDAVTPGRQTISVDSAESLDLDWIELRPTEPGAAASQEPNHESDAPVQPPNSEWTFHAEIPEGATGPRLRYGLLADTASVTVQLTIDGEAWASAVRTEHTLEPGQPLRDQALELPAAGLCRIRLRSVSVGGGSIRWLQPALVAALPPPATPVPQPIAPRPAPPRDIFVVILDAARADRFGAYGHPRRTSPWIDGLARDGVVFSVTRTQAPYTQASTGTLMTGLEPETHDVRAVHSRLSDRADTLAEALHRAGYATSAFIGCANADKPFGFAQGFDLFKGGRQAWALEGVEQMLREHQKNFFYIHLFQPHHPYVPPPPFTGLYSTLFPGKTHGGAEEMLALRRVAASLPPEEIAHLMAQYDENLLYGDARLGEILALVHRLGREREAMILVLSDHGESFAEHGVLLHGYTVHEEAIRIPLIVRPPRSWGLRPRVDLDLAATEDILPTLLELTQAPDQAPFRHGRSLVPRLLGGTAPVRESYSRAQGLQVTIALSGSRWKVHVLEGSTELYDLLSDPGEKTDLAAKRPFLAGWLRQKALERYTRNILEGRNAGLHGESAVLDPETERELKALGYVE